MRKKDTTRAMFGLTQQEIALLLQVSRSQWSLYKMGMRSLPSDAGLRLAAMELYMNSPERKTHLKEGITAQEDNKTKIHLEKQLNENDYQLQTVSRKINDVEEKFEKYKKAVCLMAFLNSPNEIKTEKALKISNNIESIAITNFSKTKSELILLQMEQELLQLQKGCIQKALRKIETF